MNTNEHVVAVVQEDHDGVNHLKKPNHDVSTRVFLRDRDLERLVMPQFAAEHGAQSQQR